MTYNNPCSFKINPSFWLEMAYGEFSSIGDSTRKGGLTMDASVERLDSTLNKQREIARSLTKPISYSEIEDLLEIECSLIQQDLEKIVGQWHDLTRKTIAASLQSHFIRLKYKMLFLFVSPQ